MNKKAESFKKYLDDKKITCFTVDEIAGDNLIFTAWCVCLLHRVF